MTLDKMHGSPLRPTDWRWQRARDVKIGRGVRPSRYFDRPAGYYWINRSLAFQTALAHAKGDHESLLETDFADIYWAHLIWTDKNQGARHSLEAHILANESDSEISEKFGLTTETVKAYEAVFFDVRSRMRYPKYILHIAINPASLKAGESRTLLKLFAFFLGPKVLDAMESGFVRPTWCNSAAAVGSALQDDTINTLTMKAALAAKLMPVNERTATSLLDQFAYLMKVGGRRGDFEASANHLMLHVDEMLKIMPVMLAKKPEDF